MITKFILLSDCDLFFEISPMENDNSNDIEMHFDKEPEIETYTPPKGFSLIRGPNDEPVLVPTFLVPATKQAFQVEKCRAEMDTEKTNCGVS